jgi:hypothetical protein
MLVHRCLVLPDQAARSAAHEPRRWLSHRAPAVRRFVSLEAALSLEVRTVAAAAGVTQTKVRVVHVLFRVLYERQPGYRRLKPRSTSLGGTGTALPQTSVVVIDVRVRAPVVAELGELERAVAVVPGAFNSGILRWYSIPYVRARHCMQPHARSDDGPKR